MDKYKAIVKYKTSYYTFNLPIGLAAIIVGLKDNMMVKHLEQFALKLGYLFQVQDDFLDCFASENITGKIGTDIQNGKCTWLFVSAKKKCSQGELELLLDNYGHEDPHKVNVVKKLYSDLRVQAECIEHIKNVSKDILKFLKSIKNEQMTQAESREYCETKGKARLAVLLKPEDATALVEAIKKISTPYTTDPEERLAEFGMSRRYWIGLTDVSKEGEWTWMKEGSRLKYENLWYPGQPDHGSKMGKETIEHCVVLWLVVLIFVKKNMKNTRILSKNLHGCLPV
ncbi:unnamed protein product [Orchesella dallaii]|uniref:Farnesyl pyrophosphate synthase n=1 Tax=Orchesella dallaii TaxID=48710 RepID=A0ABP1RS37_9HEXA